MDTLTLVGLAVAVGAIVAGQWLEGGNIGSLLQLAAAMIVVGGTIGAVMLQSPFSTFALGVRMARWVVQPPAHDREAMIARIVEWAQVTRQDGMLALENRL